MASETILIPENSLRQAIRQGLAEAGVNHDDMGYFETLIMRRVNDYKTQPVSIPNELREVLKCLS